nr:CHAP domain-containing protein [uncultured Actinomyces sp.]
MATVGADVEQLRKAAQTFRQKAEYLESTITQGLSRQITESPWKGTDADSFRNQWQSDLAPKVRQVAEALRKSADSLTRNANEQEQASSVSSGTSGAPSSAPSVSPVSEGSSSGSSSSGTSTGHTPGSPGEGTPPAPAQPSQNSGQTAARFESFRQQRLGQKTDYDGAYGFQCVDLANQYTADIFGVPARSALGGGNAKDIFGNTSEQYFTKITPSGGPQVGDIVCVGAYRSNPYGHIAIVNAVGADGSITVMEQDGFTQGPAKLRALGATERGAIQGFLRPRAERLK